MQVFHWKYSYFLNVVVLHNPLKVQTAKIIERYYYIERGSTCENITSQHLMEKQDSKAADKGMDITKETVL